MAAQGEATDQPTAERLRAAVRSIGDHARSMNLGRAARLADLLMRAESGRLPEAQRRAAAELAHQVVGSAGTFGFPEASSLAAELEQFFLDAAFDDRDRWVRARGQLDQMRDALAAEPTYQPEDE